MKKLIVTLLIVDAILLLLLFVFGTKEVILSFEIAFLSSSAVILASFESYKKAINKRVSLIEGFDEPDTIDKIEDPRSLYDDEIQFKGVKEVLKEEKERLKSSRSLKESLKESKNFFNPVKLIAYILLVSGFFYLNSNGYLNIFVYLISLATSIVISVWFFLGELNAK